ncbi:class I SAM-dependent methyltransferase [Sediminivirga luteola]|uniref:Putative methyltransferase n=1 Tax=Sediminivirga luteola TaxID=1774748 RepID=A0A8J2XJV7_9MICO|nr:class I SAM-dependent methyltransferase [Sediminivirga luteola]MCI2267031.1 class I SAM-dependent methyltransferase [Sediminivirga luteola]GGA09400.1 putative methyltransferase [Sediminivirga luteola]
MGVSDEANSFGQAADSYDRARPEYPEAALRWLLPESARQVADVGAGTGKLTGVLARLGIDVTAVEPDGRMRAQLSRRLPELRALAGTAEEIPLPDAAVDAVTFGQAWHWVDVDAASAEVGRVLRPGGVLGLVWNIRDTSVPWVAELGETMGSSKAERMVESGTVRVGAPFGPLEEHTVRWETTLTVDSLVDLAASRSYIITAEPAQREETLRRVRALAERVAGEQGTLTLPYRTHVYRAVRP